MDHDRTDDDRREPDQTWGQGEGGHEPTLPPEDGPAGHEHEADAPSSANNSRTEGMDR